MAVSATPLTVAARTGRAVRLAAGEALEIVNTQGSQVVDTWALSAIDRTEYLSMEQTRRMLFKLWPQQGDALYVRPPDGCDADQRRRLHAGGRCVSRIGGRLVSERGSRHAAWRRKALPVN